jgi:dihydroorotase
MKSILILNATIINENSQKISDIFVKDGRINQISNDLSHINADINIDATGKYIVPGMIDDQVHFREPGLTDKADIRSESLAAVIGGTTSFMDMPNNKPPIITNEGLDKKFEVAKNRSFANYSFYLGATNENIEEIKNTIKRACGIKVFMGASTGNMLVDDPKALEQIFIHAPKLIATHCESSPIIDKNFQIAKEKYGDNIPLEMHTQIRSRECCIESSSLAINLAKNFGSRLHVLHLTTRDELDFFSNNYVENKSITAEVCIHHMLYSEKDYARKKGFIKCNPSIKEEADRLALIDAVNNNVIDVIATDHAPHLISEKTADKYEDIPAGLPVIQHSFRALLEFYHNGIFSLEKIIEKVSHNPAICYDVKDRGFVREGYWADLVLIEFMGQGEIDETRVMHKCGWSAFSDVPFKTKVLKTIVSGNIAYDSESGEIPEQPFGLELEFND